MPFLKTLLCAVLFVSPTFAFAKKLVVDPNHSTILFESTHLKVSTIPGRFAKFDGTLNLDEKNITKSQIEFSVDVASIDTDVTQRDEHLRSADFFEVEKYPKATFKSTSIKKKGKNLVLNGDLTIKDVTKNVSFDVKNLGKVHDPVMKTDKYVFNAATQLNRRDFNVSYGTDALIKNEIKLIVNLETMPPAEQKE